MENKKQQPVKKEKFDAKKHWTGMPKFEQPGILPIKTLKVNFLTKEDMLKFSKLIGQEITAKTPSIWYPIQPEETALDKRWSDKKPSKR